MNVKIEITNRCIGKKVVWDYHVYEDGEYLIGEGVQYGTPTAALVSAMNDISDAEE